MIRVGVFRNLSGALLAILLALAVLTPAVDTFVCIGDEAVATAQANIVASKNLPAQQHDDGDSSCIHGHCHHWVGYPRMSVRLAVATATGRTAPIAGRYDQPSSAPPIELLRPPQA